MKNILVAFLILFAPCVSAGTTFKKDDPKVTVAAQKPDPIKDKAPVVASDKVIKTDVKAPAVVKPSEVPNVVSGSQAQDLIEVASKYTYVRESKGFNRSKEIDEWNKLCKVPMGSPYCASFLSSVHKEAGVKSVISAWSPDTVSTNNIAASKVQGGDVGGIYFPSKKRIAHVYMVEKVKGNYIHTIEANTSPDASSGSAKDREGDGVFKKLRSKKLMEDSRNKFSRYWK